MYIHKVVDNNSLTKLLNLKEKISGIYGQFISATFELSKVWDELSEDFKKELKHLQLDLMNTIDTHDISDNLAFLNDSLGNVCDILNRCINEENMTFEEFKALAEKMILPEETSIFIVKKYKIKSDLVGGFDFDTTSSDFAIATTFEMAKKIITDNWKYQGVDYEDLFYHIFEYENNKFIYKNDYLRTWLFNYNGEEIANCCVKEIYEKYGFRGYIGKRIKPGQIVVALNLHTHKGLKCVITAAPYTIEKCWEEREMLIQKCKAKGRILCESEYNKYIGYDKTCYEVYIEGETRINEVSPVYLLPIKDLESQHLSKWYENHITSKSE